VSMTGGVPVFTREYVVRGAKPFGPVCPGAGLLLMADDGMGAKAALSTVGSGNADPIAPACLDNATTHHARFAARARSSRSPLYRIPCRFEKLERTDVQVLLERRPHLGALRRAQNLDRHQAVGSLFRV